MNLDFISLKRSKNFCNLMWVRGKSLGESLANFIVEMARNLKRFLKKRFIKFFRSNSFGISTTIPFVFVMPAQVKLT